MSASILVVDDERGIRDLLNWELSGCGYNVTEACDGRQAIELIGQSSFDLVISDVRMPGLGGLEVLRAVREKAPETEIIISTGYATLETAVECVRAGAFDLLQKPCSIPELLSSVGRALERRQLRAVSSLYQACQAIFAAPNDPRLPETIVNVAVRVTSADQAALLLFDAEGKLYAAHASGSAAPDLEMARRALEQKAPVMEAEQLAYPLTAGPRAVGALTLHRAGNRPFRTDDLDRVSVLASQVLLALQNGWLIGQMVASERLATIGQLAAGVAHEISNPVAYVQSSHSFLAEALAELPPSEQVTEMRAALTDAIEGTTRVREIAKDLKALARGDSTGEREAIDLTEAIHAAMRISGAAVKNRATVLEQLADDSLVWGDTGRLSQVFINLIVNAAQAMDGWNGPKEIRLATRREGDRVIATVRDTGPGIKPEHLPRLFESFFTTKPAGVGTGLGLSICRQLVRRYDGDIRVESALGQGATFTVTLRAAS
jgi:two-component system NtrC family sensor kinase